MFFKRHPLFLVLQILAINYQILYGCNISKCTNNFDLTYYTNEAINNIDIDEICFNLIRVYHCLLDYVSEDCLINRNYVVSFNNIEGRLKDYNCRLNKHYKNYKFYNFIKTHLTTTTASSQSSQRSYEHPLFNYKTTKPGKSPQQQQQQTSHSEVDNVITKAPNSTAPLFEFVESEYYDEQSNQQASKSGEAESKKLLEGSQDHGAANIYDTPCFMANLNKRCNFFRNANFSYILSNDYRVGRRGNSNGPLKSLSGKVKKNDRDANAYESLPLIDNSYINLNVDFNQKLDFKIQLTVKATNCTRVKLFSVHLINGHLTQNEYNTDLVLKSKYNLESKSKLLFVYYKPFNMILVLNQNKLKRKFSLSIEYPDFNFNFDNQIDFSKFKSSLCNFNNRNFVVNSNEERSLVRFNKIKLNNNQLNKCFYMNEHALENFNNVASMNTIFLNLIKQTCKFESLVELVENRHVTSDIYQYQSKLPALAGSGSSSAVAEYREINLNLFFDYEPGEANGDGDEEEYEDDEFDNDYAEDESIDQQATRRPYSAGQGSATAVDSRRATTVSPGRNSSLNPQYVLNYDNIDNIHNYQVNLRHSKYLILLLFCIVLFYCDFCF